MARTIASLTPGSADFPSSDFPQLTQQDSTRRRLCLAYDATTDESCWWTFAAPQGIATPLTAIITYFMASATSGSVRFEVFVEAVSDNEAIDLDAADSYDASNNAGETVPGTQGNPSQLSITLTNNDSIAAADMVRIKVNRDADGTTGTDDAAGDCYVLLVEIRDNG